MSTPAQPRPSQLVPPVPPSAPPAPTAPPQQRASQMVPTTTVAAPNQSPPPQVPSSQRMSQLNPQSQRRASNSSPSNSRRPSQIVPSLPIPRNSQSSPQQSPTRRPSQRSPQRSPSRRASQMVSAQKPSGSTEGVPAQAQGTDPLNASRRPSQAPSAAQASAAARRASQAPPQMSEAATSSQTAPTSQGSAVRRASNAPPQAAGNNTTAGSPQGTETPQSSSPPSPPTSASGSSPGSQSPASTPVPLPAESTDRSAATVTPDHPPGVEQPKEPERAVPFREKPELKIMRRISLEMRHRMFLMGLRVTYNELGPTGCLFYVMGEIGKTFIVKLRRFPCCQCGDFLIQRLCKHMMFVSLRVFRLEQSDHRIWQEALLPSELSALLAHPLITPPVKPPYQSRIRRLLRPRAPPEPPPPPQPEKSVKEDPICCPICFDEIQFFDNEVKRPLGAKRGPKPKLEMGTRRKKEDKVKVEEALAEPWAERLKKWEPLLHCPQPDCQVNGCMKIVHEICYLKWNRFKKVSYDIPRICTVNNFYPCAFTSH